MGGMSKDLLTDLKIISLECFICKDQYKAYEIQKMPISLCKMCTGKPKFLEITTTGKVIQDIIKIAEKENNKINNNLYIDVALLIKNLQE